jgi:nicotinamidase-related amidase
MTGPSLTLDLSRSAVLSMDLQAGTVGIYTKPDPALPDRAGMVIEAARKRQIRVIHVQVGFRPGLPEVSPRNALFGAIKSSPQHQQLFRGPLGQIHPAVAAEADEVVITKHRISAFAGTDLEMILGANQIDTLILMGISTSGVVLSTFLHASDRDYRLLVVKDCCTDLDLDVHNCLVDKFFPSRATVIMSEQFIAQLGAH